MIDIYNILRYTPGEDFDQHHFAGIFWTNILANIVAILIILSTLSTITYLIINLSLKLRINLEIKKVLRRDFLITDLETMTFFSLIEYISITDEEELNKKLKRKFLMENQERPNMIENQMSLYKNVFTNFKTYKQLSRWNKSTDILKHFYKNDFSKISHLSIASNNHSKEIIFIFHLDGQPETKTVENKKYGNLSKVRFN
ncbi:MAG: hypothetical protein ACRCXE_01255 [Metamycoplasmataceae bacterium]